MGDVLDILGGSGVLGDRKGDSKKRSASAAAITSPAPNAPASTQPKKKMKGITREVYSLLGISDGKTNPAAASDQTEAIAPLVPALLSSETGRRFRIEPEKKVRKWIWSSFQHSARGSGPDANPVKHWQVTGSEGVDYSFAKFNKTCFVVNYSRSADDYQALNLSSDAWTKEDTDYLLDMCQKFDMRWPVITDRWEKTPLRSMLDVQTRYYDIAKKILSSPTVAGVTNEHVVAGRLTTKAMNAARSQLIEFNFNHDHEKRRLEQLERMFARSRQDELEEQKLLQELRKIEEQLHRLTDARAGSSSKLQPTQLEQALRLGTSILDTPISIAKELSVGVSLRSSRLSMNPSVVGVGTKMMKRLGAILHELNVPVRPLPTALVCDEYDELRKDIFKLMIVEKELSKKTLELQSLGGIS